MIKIVGYGIFLLAGLWMWVVEILAFAKWWDLTGILISVFAPPIALAFPFVYWVKEGVFPLMYFVVWGIGLLGMFMGAFFDKDTDDARINNEKGKNISAKAKNRSNNWAKIGFVIGLFSILYVSGLIFLLGLVVNSIGLYKAGKHEGKGKWFAMAGLVITVINAFAYLYTLTLKP